MIWVSLDTLLGSEKKIILAYNEWVCYQKHDWKIYRRDAKRTRLFSGLEML